MLVYMYTCSYRHGTDTLHYCYTDWHHTLSTLHVGTQDDTLPTVWVLPIVSQMAPSYPSPHTHTLVSTHTPCTQDGSQLTTSVTHYSYTLYSIRTLTGLRQLYQVLQVLSSFLSGLSYCCVPSSGYVIEAKWVFLTYGVGHCLQCRISEYWFIYGDKLREVVRGPVFPEWIGEKTFRGTTDNPYNIMFQLINIGLY